MNKYIGLRCSLLLMLCALLACCSQDDDFSSAPDASAASASVPLEFSAEIDGGTRAGDLKETFMRGDQIKIYVGDNTENYYTYELNENYVWEAINDNNVLKLTSSKVKLTAKYSDREDDVFLSPFDMYVNNLVATAEDVSITSHKVNFKFTHEACRLIVNVLAYDGSDYSHFQYNIRAYDNWHKLLGEELCREFINGGIILVHVPTTATTLYVDVYGLSGETGGEDNVDSEGSDDDDMTDDMDDDGSENSNMTTYKFELSNLEGGKTYNCNVYKYLNKSDVQVGDVYLSDDDIFVRVLNNEEINYTLIEAIRDKAWGIVVDKSDCIYVTAMNDYEDGLMLTPTDSFTFYLTQPEHFNTIMTNQTIQSLLNAFMGHVPVAGDTYWISSVTYYKIGDAVTDTSTSSPDKMSYKMRELKIIPFN